MSETVKSDEFPSPDQHARGGWTDDDRARAWRDAFDSMHQRAMRAEAVIRDNWCGSYWRAVNHQQADEVRTVLNPSLQAREGGAA